MERKRGGRRGQRGLKDLHRDTHRRVCVLPPWSSPEQLPQSQDALFVQRTIPSSSCTVFGLPMLPSLLAASLLALPPAFSGQDHLFILSLCSTEHPGAYWRQPRFLGAPPPQITTTFKVPLACSCSEGRFRFPPPPSTHPSLQHPPGR